MLKIVSIWRVMQIVFYFDWSFYYIQNWMKTFMCVLILKRFKNFLTAKNDLNFKLR